MSAARVRLSIDRLVLRGFSPAQRDTIVADMLAEISQGLGTADAPASLGETRSVAELRAAASPAVSGASPGAAAGRALLQSLRGSKA